MISRPISSLVLPAPLIDAQGIRWCGRCRSHALGSVTDPENTNTCPCCTPEETT